jgi:DNA invertase Pin-like site-specific DNA recombinase
MRTIAYARVSTEDQANNGVSLDLQEGRLRAYTEAKGWSLVQVVSEDASAKSLNRPGLQSLLDLVKSGTVDALVVYKLDRLTRSVSDLDYLTRTLNEHDVALVSLNESLDGTTAAGRLMMNLLAVVSQWEREAIGERTRAALSHKKANGEVYARVPFGYRRVGDRLEPVTEELEVVRQMQEWEQGGASLREIARRLNAEGVRSKRGGKWSHRTVGYVLRNDLYSNGAALG